MRITIAAVGKLKEPYLRAASAEYTKRLAPYCTLQIQEVSDEGYAEGLSPVAEEKIKLVEWQKTSRLLKKGTFIIVLDLSGEQVSSRELAARIDQLALSGHSSLTFLIGGSLGLPQAAFKCADWCLSFSRLTFPHQLMRIILLEQIYRSFKISRGEPYHK